MARHALPARKNPSTPQNTLNTTLNTQIDGDGAVLDFLLDAAGDVVSSVSAVHEHPPGRLWLGNLNGDFVSYVDV